MIKNPVRNFVIIIIILFNGLFLSCNSKKEPSYNNPNIAKSDSVVDSLIKKIPSYSEITSTLQLSERNFSAEIINSPDTKVPENLNKLALQTGILMTDVTFCYSLNEVHLSMKKYKQLEKRIKKMNLPVKNLKKTSEKLEIHRDNKKEIIKIVSAEYDEINNSLIAGRRIALSALVMTGVWIESSRILFSDSIASGKIKEKQLKTINPVKEILKNYDNAYIRNLSSRISEITESKNSDVMVKRINSLYREAFNE